MSIDKEKLRAIAKTIVPIPEHYRLELEDSIPKGDEQERCFIWEDPRNQDNTIEITLDLVTGRLTRLAIDREEVGETQPIWSDGDARSVADEFVAKHAPNPGEYGAVFIEKRRDRVDFTFRQEVGGLPLPDTGCKLTLDTKLNVVRYHLDGRMDCQDYRPEWPDSIVDADTVKVDIQRNLQMELRIVCLDPCIYEMEGTEQEYRLVYEPNPEGRWIDAVTGRDLFGPEHYALPPSHPLLGIDTVPMTATDGAVSWEQGLGINLEHYVLEKSVDDGERIKSLYQLKDQEEANPEWDSLSVDAYMKRKWGDNLRIFKDSSIMVQLEKSTGRLVGFHWMDSWKEGTPTLNREQCWKKADQFLRMVFPDYIEYLQLEDDEEQSEEESCEREFFYLPVYIDGIPVNHERVMVSVSKSSGVVCTYMGVSYEMIRELAGRSFLPNFMSDAALDDYVEHMKLHLEWSIDQDQKDAVYQLLYKATANFSDVHGNKRTIRYIDAVSGELIWEK